MKKHRQGTEPKEVLFRMDILTIANTGINCQIKSR